MQEQHKKQFLALIRSAFAAHGREVSIPVVASYWERLSTYELDDVADAIRRAELESQQSPPSAPQIAAHCAALAKSRRQQAPQPAELPSREVMQQLAEYTGQVLDKDGTVVVDPRFKHPSTVRDAINAANKRFYGGRSL
ncbi:MAG: hypothetical protein E6Q97_37405 [Desulfurellales bacterium]|nr:MAG: hypothetical protein E6Q97_37405 [Desulfurellales bacterium]